MKFGLSDHAIEFIVDIFARFPEIKEVIIFGSRARGNFKKGSDIDLALKGEIDFTLQAKIKMLLEETIPLPYFFDVVVYDDLKNTALKEHIDKHGKIFYLRDKK